MATSSISSSAFSALSNTTGSISSAGIGSGLDVNSIVTQLMAVEKRPLAQMQQQAGDINTKLSEVGKMQSYFSALRDKAQAVTNPSLWTATTASSSDSAAVSVSTGGGTPATAGSYAVSVSKLAQAQSVTSSALASGANLNSGRITIELGSYDSDSAPTSFTPKDGSSAVSIDIGSGDTSLSAIRDKINGSGAGVLASIITDANGSRLSLRSRDTGAANAFRVSVTETQDDGDAASGLSMLGYDATASSPGMTRSQTAGDAQLSINGVALSSASNTLANAVDGMSLTLSKVTTADVTVNVAADTATAKKAITDFVSAFNTLASFIRTDTAYNADNKSGGPLQGDQATLSLQHQLRNVLNQPSTASGTWSALSDIGISMAADGTLSTNTGKLDNALGNLPALKKLLAADGADTASTGFIRRFQNLAKTALDSGGAFESRTSGLRSSLDRNTKQQDAMQTRLTATEARLRAQYQALDTKMASLTTLSGYVAKIG